jgi:hypothetical protein
MKALVLFLGLVSSTIASAASLTETNTYKELNLDFANEKSVILTVQGERYRSTRARTLISIKKVSADTYIVDQENLYYPAVMVFPPLPTVTLRDTASATIKKGRSYTVRVLVPANLSASVKVIRNITGPTCMAYWTGFNYDLDSDSCVQIGRSGCSNPFEFQTLSACEAGNLLN